MDLSIPLDGIQRAETALNSAAVSISQGSLGIAQPNGRGDSVDLSTAVVNLLQSKLSFLANTKVASVEDNLTRSEISLLG
jgi:hypothetical protein